MLPFVIFTPPPLLTYPDDPRKMLSNFLRAVGTVCVCVYVCEPVSYLSCSFIFIELEFVSIECLHGNRVPVVLPILPQPHPNLPLILLLKTVPANALSFLSFRFLYD